MLGLVGELQRKVAPGSVVVLQSERGVPLDDLPDRAALGRTLLRPQSAVPLGQGIGRPRRAEAAHDADAD